VPFKGLHACRLRDPDEFQEGSFRTISAGSGRNRVNIIVARPKGKSTTRAQAIRYPMDVWTEARARADCERKGGTFEAGVTEALASAASLEELGLSDEDVERLLAGEEVVVSVAAAQPSDGGRGATEAPRRIDLMDGIEDEDLLDVSQEHSAVEEHDGLIWKELLVTGSWPGSEDVPPLTITREMLEQIKESFDAGVLAHVDVPVGGSHEPDAVEKNSGFVRALEIRSRDSGEYSLWAGIRFTDPVIETKVRDGSIANVSARLQRSFTDPITGKTWPLVLWHVALTNKPVLKGLRPFVAVSLQGLRVRAYKGKEVHAMSQAEHASTQEELEGQPAQEESETQGGAEDQTQFRPLSEEERERIRQEERERIRQEVAREYESALQEVRSRLSQAETLAIAHRDQLHRANVKQILLALQGRGEHERVKLPPGHAFAPVVVRHVQPLLEADVGEESAVKLSVGGEEQQFSVTGLVLNLLNAVAEARDGAIISLAQHGSQNHHPPGGPTDSDKDAEIDRFLKERGLSPAGQEEP
jgi:hypothetical protein